MFGRLLSALRPFVLPAVVGLVVAFGIALRAANDTTGDPAAAALVPEDFRPARPVVKQPHEQFHRERAWPAADIPSGAYAEALAAARAMPVETMSLHSSAGVWTASGPTNVGGRITSIAVDPASNANIWIGAADGGVLRSTNSGVNWTPLLDDFGGLSIGHLVHHPTDPGVLLCGTGEPNASGDSYDGIGLLRTTDGGDNWEVVGLENSQRIARVAYDLTNPERIFVASSGGLYSLGSHRGIYRSTDGGQNWTQQLFVSDSTSAIDVVVDPTDGNRVYAAMWDRLRSPENRTVAGPNSGIWRSTDGGDTWARMTNGVPTTSDVARIGLALAPSSPSTLYASFSEYSSGSGTTLSGVWKTTNGGDSWNQTSGSGLGNPYSSFGWYFGQIVVDPANSDEVWVLGVDLMRSTNGGSSWSENTGNQHVDFHALWIDPAQPNRTYTGNDGGFFLSTNNGAGWTKRYDLPITQFYAISVDPQLPHRIYGGTQDNSTNRTLTGDTDDWDVIAFGDGFTTLVHPTNSNIIYAEYQYGGLVKSTNLGGSWSFITDGVSGSDRINWHMPFLFDPDDPETLYLGTHRVYRSTNGGDFWVPISGDLTDGPGGGDLTFGTLKTLAVSPVDTNVLWAGADDGNVDVSTNGGGSWTDVDAALPVRAVTRVTADWTEAAVAYVTVSGYKFDEFLPHVYRTTDFGATWTDISGNLPPAPVNDLIIDPQNGSHLFVATDVGVYFSANIGGSWAALGSGLPIGVVADLELHDDTRSLVAGTHGRSAFRFDLNDLSVGVSGPLAQDSILDLAPARPNPSRSASTLSFTLQQAGNARLTIYDTAGRRVRTLHDGATAEGTTSVTWEGRDDAGKRVAAGVYFARLDAHGMQRTVQVTRLQ